MMQLAFTPVTLETGREWHWTLLGVQHPVGRSDKGFIRMADARKNAEQVLGLDLEGFVVNSNPLTVRRLVKNVWQEIKVEVLF